MSTKGKPSNGGKPDNGGAASQDKAPQPNPQLQASSKCIQQLQTRVDAVNEIMRDNMEKVLDRGDKISELDNKAFALKESAENLEKQADYLESNFLPKF